MKITIFHNNEHTYIIIIISESILTPKKYIENIKHIWNIITSQYLSSKNNKVTNSTRFLDLCFLNPVFTLANFNCLRVDWVTIITVWTVSAWLAGQVLIVLPSYTMPRTPPVLTPAAGRLAPIQI